jgi:hypothetical protein
MDDKGKLLREANEGYAELRAAVAGLDDDQASRVWLGAWGVREILIHIAAWDREMTPALARIGRGEAAFPAGVSYDDADGWNARFVAARSGVKLGDVLAELDTAHRDLIAAAAALDDSHLVTGAPGRDVFTGTATQHYQEHTGQIREWRKDNAR